MLSDISTYITIVKGFAVCVEYNLKIYRKLKSEVNISEL